MKDYRTIPVDVLRDFALTKTEIYSIRQVAAEIGISHSALHKFVTGRTKPQPRTRRSVGLWYLKMVETGEGIDVTRPFVRALETLLTGLPEAQRSGTAARVLADVETGHAEAGAPLPRWLQVLRASDDWLREPGG